MHQDGQGTDHTYLLRCWQEGKATPGQEPDWRFLVEEVLKDGRRRQGFSSLEALFAFLDAELSGEADEYEQKENEDE